MNKFARLVLILLTLFLSIPQPVLAAPYFYMNGSASAETDSIYSVDIYIVSETNTLTAMQTIIDFDENYLDTYGISIVNSSCSFWAPADPDLGYGNSPSPYYYPSSSSNKAVLACGFANPGYISSSVNGDLVAKLRFTPSASGSTTLSFDATNTEYRYIATEVTGIGMSDFSVTISESTDSSTPTPSGSPTPTPAPTATPSSETDSVSAEDQTTYTDDILTFVELGADGATTGTDEGVTLEVIDEDDSLPTIPDLEPRAKATPFVFSLLGGGGGGGGDGQDPGEVLAAQSLRELLIPGKSQADKTVVMVNLISTLTFLALLAIVVWRLITTIRLNQVKAQHMKQYLTSELATLESKLNTVNTPEGAAQLRADLNEAMEKLSQEEASEKKKKK